MRWQLKSFILRQLSVMPGGKSAYLTIQRILGTTRPQPRRDFTRAIELIELIRETGQQINGTSCYEVGTGWHPYTPLAFYLAGAEQIETVDVNPWLSLDSARKAIAAAEPHLEWLCESLQLDKDEVWSRYRKINLQAKSLSQLLETMNCRYVYPGDATNTPHPPQSFDFVVSSNVLEHIPEEILKNIAKESWRILNPGGLAVHRFNPGDHYANDDSRVSTGNFLKFSENKWKPHGSGLAYHNRLRCSQYSQIFREAGYLSLIEKTRVDERVLQEITNGKQELSPEFQEFAPADLASDYMWTVGMKANVNADNAFPANRDYIVQQTPKHRTGNA